MSRGISITTKGKQNTLTRLQGLQQRSLKRDSVTVVDDDQKHFMGDYSRRIVRSDKGWWELEGELRSLKVDRETGGASSSGPPPSPPVDYPYEEDELPRISLLYPSPEIKFPSPKISLPEILPLPTEEEWNVEDLPPLPPSPPPVGTSYEVFQPAAPKEIPTTGCYYCGEVSESLFMIPEKMFVFNKLLQILETHTAGECLQCPICWETYSTSGPNRMCIMKCGHDICLKCASHLLPHLKETQSNEDSPDQK